MGQNQYIGKGEGKSTVPMTVRVTVKDGDISNVEILEDWETPGFTDRAKEQTIAQIIEKEIGLERSGNKETTAPGSETNPKEKETEGGNEMIFTVEETTLLRAFDTSTRNTAILSLMKEMGMMQDEDLITQCLSMVKKLENTTDEDFAKVDFTVYDGEDDDEQVG